MIIEMPDIYDYDKTTMKIKAKGKDFELEILSALSPEFIRASGIFDSQVKYAQENNIELRDTIVTAGLETKVASAAYKEINAHLSAAIVSNWPFEEDIIETLVDNQGFANMIQSKATELAKEFGKKKGS